MVQKHLKGGACILLLFFSYFVNAQGFELLDSVEIKQHSNVNNYAFEQIYSKETIAYYYNAKFYDGIDSVRFFCYTPETKSLEWYSIPILPEESIYGMAIEQDWLVALMQYEFYIYKKDKHNYRLVDKVKLQHQGKIRADKVYFLDSTHLVLASDYDYAEDLDYYKNHPIYADFTFYVYDLKRRKYSHSNRLNIGKGVLMGIFPFQPLAFNNNYIAVSHTIKARVTLYSKKIKKIKDIFFPPFSINTDSVFEKYLNDSLLTLYRYRPKSKMQIMTKHKLYHYPLIKGVAFLNEDTLMCIVNNHFDTFKESRDVYLYSIKQDKIVDIFSVKRQDANTPRVFFLHSGLIQFNDNVLSDVCSFFDEKQEKIYLYLQLIKYVDDNQILKKKVKY